MRAGPCQRREREALTPNPLSWLDGRGGFPLAPCSGPFSPLNERRASDKAFGVRAYLLNPALSRWGGRDLNLLNGLRDDRLGEGGVRISRFRRSHLAGLD